MSGDGCVSDSDFKKLATVVAFCVIRALVKLHSEEVSADGQSASLVQKTARESTYRFDHAIPSPLIDILQIH